VFGRPTYLRYRPKRDQRQECEGKLTTTQNLDWHNPNSPQAVAYDERLLLQLVNTTIEDVAIKEGDRDFEVIVKARMEDGGGAILGVLLDRQKVSPVRCLAQICPDRGNSRRAN
jgi:hypothetical protein